MIDSRDLSHLTRAELEAQFERCRMLSRVISELVWHWDLLTDEIIWDFGFASPFGYKPEEIEPRLTWWSRRVHPEDFEKVWTRIQDSWSAGSPFFTAEYRFFKSDGSIAHVWDRGYTERDALGKPVRMIGSMQDVTVQKQNEERLRKSEAKFRHIYDSNMLGIIYWSLNGKVVDANDAFLKSSGYTLDDLQQGRINWLKMTPEKYGEEDQHAIDEVRSRGHSAPYEKELIRKDGTRFPILIAGAALEGEEGGVAFVADLSERDEGIERFRRFADAMPQIAWMMNEGTGELEFVNEAWVRYAGLSTEDSKRLGTLIAIHPDDRESVMRAWESARLHGTTFESEMRLRNAADGSYRAHLARCVPIRDKEGRIVRWFGTNTDIEDLKTALQTYNEQNAKMIASSKLSALGEMAGGIAHEINNPLAIIQGRAAQLRVLAGSGKADAETVAKFATMIESTATRISRTVQSLKNVARDGAHEPFVSHSLRTIVQETVDLCRERFKSGGVDLFVDEIPAELKIECRSIQISQVLLNLLNNAYDALEGIKMRWIRIALAEDESEVVLTVTDSGCGIPSEIREKIMQPFFTTKAIGRGTGLGLSVSKGIVEAHHGQLWLDEGSENTRFGIRLPKRQSAG